MLKKDSELVNFSEEHELNGILRKLDKSQSIENRKVLCELGKECKAKLNKRILEQTEFCEFVKQNLDKLKDKA